MNAPHTTLDTTETSLQILELVRDLDGANLTEVAEGSGLAKSTAHSHLQTLYAQGFLTREGDDYYLGYKFLNLGEYVRFRDPDHAVVERTVQDLADTTGEEVAFGVEDNGRQITVHEVYDDSHVRDRHAGSYHYMHNTATGKAILAAYPEYRVDEIVDQWGLPETSERTITSRDALKEELNAIRERGYAINDEEFLDGLKAIGSVVRGQSDIVGGISVSGPAYRITVDRLVEDIWPVLQAEIGELEAMLDASEGGPEASAADR